MRSWSLLAVCVGGFLSLGGGYTLNSTLNPDRYFLAERMARRGHFDKALPIWEDLSEKGDCDAD